MTIFSLSFELQAFTFAGVASVSVKINSDDVTEIVLHSLDIDIYSAVFQFSGGEVAATAISYQKEKLQTATLSFGTALPAGSGTIKMNFTGVLNDKVQLFLSLRSGIS